MCAHDSHRTTPSSSGPRCQGASPCPRGQSDARAPLPAPPAQCFSVLLAFVVSSGDVTCSRPSRAHALEYSDPRQLESFMLICPCCPCAPPGWVGSERSARAADKCRRHSLHNQRRALLRIASLVPCGGSALKARATAPPHPVARLKTSSLDKHSMRAASTTRRTHAGTRRA